MPRVSLGQFSRAARRPRWYRAQLANRPPDIAERGTWREKRPKVEDAIRYDALALYVDAQPVSDRIRERRWLYSCREAEVVIEPCTPGTRSTVVNETEITLTPRQSVPGRSYRHFSAGCPQCAQ